MAQPLRPPTSPLGTEPIEEISLADAPLVNVLAQIRYPKNPVLATKTGFGHLYDALKHSYPILREPQQVNITLGPNGVTQVPGENLVQLTDRHASWSLNVGATFITLSTTAYESRADFCARFSEVVGALEKIAEPVVYDRLGVRYVNRIEGEARSRIRELVRPEVLGGLSVRAEGSAELVHTLTDSLFTDGSIALQARWGALPAGTSHDPTLPPAPTNSWILDVDVFTQEIGDFIAADLTAQVEQFATRAYRFFRWAVTDVALREFGAAT